MDTTLIIIIEFGDFFADKSIERVWSNASLIIHTDCESSRSSLVLYKKNNKNAKESLIICEISNKIRLYFTNIANDMDETDRKIIDFLKTDGRTPYTEIAKSLEISEATVRYRVARLMEQKILQVIGLVDPYQLGYDAPAMIGVSVDPPLLESAAAAIAAFSEVSYLVMVSGEFDLIVEVLCRNRTELTEFLNQKLRFVTGVTRTQSSMILKTYKMSYGAQPNI